MMLHQQAFSLSDQTAFANLSGDDNPMHVDPVAARRLLFGGPVVHGIHAVCRGLDHWLATRAQPVQLKSLNVVFLKPMRVGQTVEFLVEDETDSSLKLRITTDRELATRIVCEFQTTLTEYDPSIADKAAALGECLERTDYENSSGSLPLLLPRDAAATQLPELTAKLPARQIALLLATTRLVGTKCPGLHSIYSSLQLAFENCDEKTPLALDWSVSTYDPRFGSVSLELESVVASGTIRAFVRPQPQKQASFAEVRKLVGECDFAGIKALVIGGSRGFGEVCGKLLAAGGADVCITYHRGADDAERVADDIRSGGGTAITMPYDATDPEAETETTDWSPTHLFFFATPPIARAVKNRFSPDLFREFCSFYVDSVARLVDELAPRGLVGLYYPSSVFVDELPGNMGEYAAAKAAGESLCAFLEKSRPGFQVIAPRLPKSATDQTASLVPAHNEDPAHVLLESLQPLKVPEKSQLAG
jgi:NAD(P)-dependent dehydrogenase (short-subunit alcohol dehydrogenase family)